MGRNASRVAAMHAKCSITSTAALSTSTMRADRVSARTTGITGRRELTLTSQSAGHRRSRACNGSSRFTGLCVNYFDFF